MVVMVPNGFSIVRGPKGGLAIVFESYTQQRTVVFETILVSKAKKYEIEVVLSSLQQHQLIGNTAEQSRKQLTNLLQDTSYLYKHHRFQSAQQPLKYCCAVGCSQIVPACREYCSHYHNKLQFLTERMAYHQNRGDSFGACLAASIREECCGGKANKLQPGVLSTLLGCQVPFFADNNSLLNFYEKYEDILRAPLGVRVNPLAPNKKVSDQANRAMCWSNMLTAGHDTVRLMDGRCGFLLRFLSYVRMRHGVHRLNSLKIELVDIDHRVSQWHRYMYPCPTVMCLTENIVDMQKPVPSTTLLYLNFCGVAESFDHVRAYLVAHPAKCLFSFSMARAAGKKNFENSLKSLSSAYVKKLPCERKDFVTYVIALTAADAANAVKT